MAKGSLEQDFCTLYFSAHVRFGSMSNPTREAQSSIMVLFKETYVWLEISYSSNAIAICANL